MTDSNQSSQSNEVLPERVLYLLSAYLSQHITRPIDIDPNQLAYRWVGGLAGKLEPISANLSISLSDLKGIDTQKAKIELNTKQFLAGFPASHILMTGTLGSGKSSLVRALLGKYHKYGLRVLEVSPNDLLALDKIRDAIQLLPKEHGCRYIIYCDDLAFDKQDDNYRKIKSILDGALDSEQGELLIYATSNQQQLLLQPKEDDSDEAISLSDRFGLWLTFHPMDKQTYLDICQHYIESYSLEWTEEVQEHALNWSNERNGYSGRKGYQFSRQYLGTLQFNQKQELDLQKESMKPIKRRKIPLLKPEQIDKFLSQTNIEGQISGQQSFLIALAVGVVLLILAGVVFSLIG